MMTDPEIYLPFIFAALMGLSILIYVILDGYDLGVGLLSIRATRDERDIMISSIGPFWDANETWLVLAIGILLVAFPVAHGVILSALYLPVFFLLFGLILRGVSFEFRAKADVRYKDLWDKIFFSGSLMATLAQGYMLGMYLTGLNFSIGDHIFSLLTAVCLTAGYGFIGATWLIGKTDSTLQKRAIRWAKFGLICSAVGMIAISVATPLASPRLYEKWFSLPQMFILAPLPLFSVGLIAYIWQKLSVLPLKNDNHAWHPFFAGAGLFVLAEIGLAYSFYPYVVPEKLTIYEAASASSSLFIILVGALIVLPMILGYTALSYWVFRGKTKELTYGKL